MILKGLKTILIGALFSSCAGDKLNEVEEPVSELGKIGIEVKENSSENVTVKQKIVDQDCNEFPMEKPLPYWSREGKFYITKVIEECITPEGNGGFRKNSPWVAMGVPCTAKENNIVLSGPAWRPKSINFRFIPECKMETSKKAAGEIGKQEFLVAENKLVALTPAAVIYWELPDYNVAAPGAEILLSSASLIKPIWRNIKEANSINVRLLAKENSWYGASSIFEINGKLIFESTKKFHLEVVDTYPVGQTVLKGFVRNCNKTKPAHECAIR